MAYSVNGVQQSIRTLLAASCALILAYYFKLENSWTLLPAILITQLSVNVFFFVKNSLLMLSIGIIIAIHLYLAQNLGSYFLVGAFYLFFTTGLCFYIGINKPYLLATTFFINLLGVIALTGGWGTDLLAERMQAVLLGTLVAMIIQIVCWPPCLKTNLKHTTTQFLQMLNQLQKTLFIIYSKRDYLTNHLRYEKELHQQRERLFEITERLRYFSRKAKTLKLWPSYVDHLENLFELVIALGNLRYRVKDHTTFEIAENEFIALAQKLEKLLTEIDPNLKKDVTVYVDSLIKSVQDFEELNRGALQVVVPDPVIFLIFIQNLQAICREMAYLAVNKPKYE